MNNMQSVVDFLKTRRSFPPSTLSSPFPSQSELKEIATIGMRVPDHKKLEPWRLISLEKAALEDLAQIVKKNAPQNSPSPEKAKKIKALYEDTGSVIVMVYSPKRDVQGAPEWEQHLSMGAVGVSLVNAAIAIGYGAAWMSGFVAEHPEVEKFLGIKDGEKISGLVHIGTPKHQPPERPRPNIDEKLTFL